MAAVERKHDSPMRFVRCRAFPLSASLRIERQLRKEQERATSQERCRKRTRRDRKVQAGALLTVGRHTDVPQSSLEFSARGEIEVRLDRKLDDSDWAGVRRRLTEFATVLRDWVRGGG